MPITEDFAAFFSTADFAEPGVLDGLTVNGIFDGAYADAMGLATAEAHFTLASSAVGATTSASLLVLRGITYRVRSIEHDSTGVCTLKLERQ